MKKIVIGFILLFGIISINSKERIVSLAPSLTKILFHLELEDSIVGVTDYCEYKGNVERMVKEGKIKRVSGYSSLNYEKILSVTPTIIIGVDSINIESKNQLEKLVGKDKVKWFPQPRNIKQIEDQLIEIAILLGKETKGRQIVADMEKRLNEISKKVSLIPDNKRKRVLIEIYFPPFMTAGKNTFIYDLLLKSGAKPAMELTEDWPAPSLEDVVKADPDVIVKMTHSKDKNEGISVIRAYKEGNVFIPSDDKIFLQAGVESIDAVAELFNYLYGK